MSAIQIERIDERRRALRVDEPCRAFVTERRPASQVPGWDETLAPVFGETINVSETGALLSLTEPLPLGRSVVVGLEIGGERVEAPAVVMRVSRARPCDGANVGVRFTRLSRRAQEILHRVVRARQHSPLLN